MQWQLIFSRNILFTHLLSVNLMNVILSEILSTACLLIVKQNIFFSVFIQPEKSPLKDESPKICLGVQLSDWWNTSLRERMVCSLASNHMSSEWNGQAVSV